jgi:hypothetical protein
MPPNVINVMPPADVGTGPASIRMGVDGALYVVFYNDAGVFRLAPKSLCGPKCPAP